MYQHQIDYADSIIVKEISDVITKV